MYKVFGNKRNLTISRRKVQSLTERNSVRVDVYESEHHQVSQHLDVRHVLQPNLNVVQELEDIDSIHAVLQHCIHALEGSLPVIERIIHWVFEGAHLHLPL